MFFQTNIRSIKIPDEIKIIGDSSFEGCKFLEKIEFSSKSQLQLIENAAFEDCSNLNSIDLPNSLTAIGSNAFDGCTLLSVFSLFSSENKASNLKFDNYCFKGCQKMAHFIFLDKDGDPSFNQTPSAYPFEDCGRQANTSLVVQGNDIGDDSFAYKFHAEITAETSTPLPALE
jgi:hypothetical protein